jgi:hypothetical protein
MTEIGKKSDSLIFLFIGAVIFVALGIIGERITFTSMADFKAVYYATRCLESHCDPYSEAQLTNFYVSHSHERQANSPAFSHFIGLGINLPAIFPLLGLVAIVPWPEAHLFWMLLIGCTFISTCYVVWVWAGRDAPSLSAALLFLLLTGSEILLEVGNLAGLAVSLCVLGCFCLVRNRNRWAGVVSFAISLATKPHVGIMIWLYFFLAGGRSRRRALESLAVAASISLVGVIWVSTVSPHWLSELNHNLVVASAANGPNDPGPNMFRTAAHGAGIINLQSVVSVLTPDPQIFNLVSYLVCGPLILIWIVITRQESRSELKTLIALATASALSMLPVYHRQHDTRLVLLMVPACAAIWARRLPIRWCTLAMTASTFVFTGDITMQILAISTRPLYSNPSGLAGKIAFILLARPAPIVLLGL